MTQDLGTHKGRKVGRIEYSHSRKDGFEIECFFNIHQTNVYCRIFDRPVCSFSLYPNKVAVVNWNAWGDQPPDIAKGFASALTCAAEIADAHNEGKEHPLIAKAKRDGKHLYEKD